MDDTPDESAPRERRALVLNRERSATRSAESVAPKQCARPARGVVWLLADGRTAPVRCGRSNSCEYCAWLSSVENSIVVGLDAKAEQPTVGLTLTTHRPGFDMARFRVATAQLFKWLRQTEGRQIEYLGLMEWTTGKKTAGKRPHMHALLKGLDPARSEVLEPLVSARWKTLTEGAWKVDCRPLRTPGGAIAYMVGHHHKRDQAPPRSFTGKRIRPSRGYFTRPVAEIRQEAKATMRHAAAKSITLRDLTDAEVPEDMVDDVLEQLVRERLEQPAPKLLRQKDERPREVERIRRTLKQRGV
jgi:hypothetical protein